MIQSEHLKKGPKDPKARRPKGPKAQRPEGPKARRPEGPKARMPKGPKAQRPKGPKADRQNGKKGKRPKAKKVEKPTKAHIGYSKFACVYLLVILNNFHFRHLSCGRYCLGAIEIVNAIAKKNKTQAITWSLDIGRTQRQVFVFFQKSGRRGFGQKVFSFAYFAGTRNQR